MSEQRLNLVTGVIPGCCHAKNFYNLGGAHSHPRANDLETFANAVINRNPFALNIAITNSYQSTERKYLEQCGFKHVFTDNTGMWLHAASALDINRATKGIREARARKLEEERKKRLEEQRIRMEDERKRREERGHKLEQSAKIKDVEKLIVKSDYWNIGFERTRENIKNHYGFKDFPSHHALNYWAGSLVKAINYRLKRDGRIL